MANNYIDKVRLGADTYYIRDRESGYITRDVNNLVNYTLTNSLAAVATSGDYGDLSNKPEIPVFNDARLTIYVNNNSPSSTTFRAYGPQAGSSSLTIDLTPYAQLSNMPLANANDAGCIKTSSTYGTSMNNGALQCLDATFETYNAKSNGFFISKTTLENVIAGKKLLSWNSSVAGTVGLNSMLAAGSNITLSVDNSTKVITIAAQDTTYSSLAPASGGSAVSLVTTGEKYTWNNKSDFSGNYNDLTNKPTLFSGSYNDLTNKPTIPTLTSQLTNDNNFITADYLTTITGYDTSATQTLKNVNGTLTWVTDTI